MSSYTLEALLWDNSGKSDKIWGYVRAGNNYFNFWGRRSVVDKDGMVAGGKRPSLQFKMHPRRAPLETLERQKSRKGYKSLDVDNADHHVPGFTDFFESALVEARMCGKVRNDDWFDD